MILNENKRLRGIYELLMIFVIKQPFWSKKRTWSRCQSGIKRCSPIFSNVFYPQNLRTPQILKGVIKS